MASDEEFNAGVSTTASPSVKQVNDKYVTLDTAQIINGYKTITKTLYSDLGSNYYLVNTRTDAPNNSFTPNTTMHEILHVRASDNSALGQIRVTQNTNGSNLIALEAYRSVDGEQKISSLKAYVNSDGATRAEAPTPTALSNGTDIATTSWVRSYALPTGTIIVWSTATAPSGYLICDGSAISRTTYSNLFSVIGTIYGDGDGSTTFNVPDLRDKTVWYSTLKVIGYTEKGSLPAIKGDLGYELGGGTSSVPVSGAIKGYAGTVPATTRIFSTLSSANGKSYFDASGSSSIYRTDDVQIVVPTALDILFCIKYQ